MITSFPFALFLVYLPIVLCVYLIFFYTSLSFLTVFHGQVHLMFVNYFLSNYMFTKYGGGAVKSLKLNEWNWFKEKTFITVESIWQLKFPSSLKCRFREYKNANTMMAPYWHCKGVASTITSTLIKLILSQEFLEKTCMKSRFDCRFVIVIVIQTVSSYFGWILYVDRYNIKFVSI